MPPQPKSTLSTSRHDAGPSSSSPTASAIPIESDRPGPSTRSRNISKGKQPWSGLRNESFDSASSSSLSYSSSPAALLSDSPSAASSSHTHHILDDFPRHPLTPRAQGKAPYELPPPSSLSHLIPLRSSPLGPTMQSHQNYKSVDLNSGYGDPDVPPRLVTYSKSCHGFTWNDELFLPSHMLHRYMRSGRGRRKQYDADLGSDDEVEVAEVHISEEEARRILP